MMSEAELERRRRDRDVEGADAVVGLVDDEEALRRAVKSDPIRASQLTFASPLAAKAAKNALAPGRWGTRGRESAPRPIRRLWQEAAEANRAAVALRHPAAAALVAGDSGREEEVVPLARVWMDCVRMRIHTIPKRHAVHSVAERARDDQLGVTSQCEVRRPIQIWHPDRAPRGGPQDAIAFHRLGQLVARVRLGWRAAGWPAARVRLGWRAAGWPAARVRLGWRAAGWPVARVRLGWRAAGRR